MSVQYATISSKPQVRKPGSSDSFFGVFGREAQPEADEAPSGLATAELNSKGDVIIVDWITNQVQGHSLTWAPFTFILKANEPSGQSAQDLRSLFQIEDPEPVNEFLEEYTFLSQVLPEVKTAISEIFSTERVSLQYLEDPDDDDSGHLIVNIFVYGDPEQELPRLARFDELWWRSNRNKVQRKLCVDLRYESPA